MHIDLGSLFEKRVAQSRSISAENPRGEAGKGGMATADTTLHEGAANSARELGQGWSRTLLVHPDN